MQHRHNFFDEYSFEHVALPELSLDDIDTSCEFLGRRLSAPVLISCMTGGTEAAGEINRNLARAAEDRRIALGVGSQRRPHTAPSPEQIHTKHQDRSDEAVLLAHDREYEISVGLRQIEQLLHAFARAEAGEAP